MNKRVIAPIEAVVLILTVTASVSLAVFQHSTTGSVDFKPFSLWIGGTMVTVLMVMYRIVTYLNGFLVEVRPMVAIIQDWLRRMAP